MIAARMTRLDDSWRVQFPFDRGVVESIKQMVPSHSRTFDPDEKAWYVAPRYAELIRNLLESVFLEVEVDAERTAYTPPTGTTPRTEYHVLHLQPTAPPELVEVAYRCLSRLYHPDRGGNHETMTAINEAVSIIRRTRA